MMDNYYLEMARSAIKSIKTTTDPGAIAALASAAALIALAERRPIEAELCESKPRFVQVAGCTFDPSRIESVTDSSDKCITLVTVHMRCGDAFYLEKENATAFLRWWSANADVVRLDVAD